MIDRRVGGLLHAGAAEVDQPAKAELLGVLVEQVCCGEEIGPLMVALPRVTASLVACLRRERAELLTPQALSQDGPKFDASSTGQGGNREPD